MAKKTLAILCVIAGVMVVFAFSVAWTLGIDRQPAPLRYGALAVLGIGLVLFFAGVFLIGKSRQEQADKDRESRKKNRPDPLKAKQSAVDDNKNNP